MMVYFVKMGLLQVFDNYDEITGTLSGRGEQEVHDTKGIVVQNRKLGETPLELSAKERID
ncbi:MAG: hypothetical protein GY702_25065 [Desulfobulbaceae bacterium]|nr:hypothetical protein [Desulfobulbaceae bacterium]